MLEHKFRKVKLGIKYQNIVILLIASLSILVFPIYNLYANISNNNLEISETFSDGLIINFKIPEIKFGTKEYNGKIFQNLEFEGCSLTNEIGKPQIPIKSVLLGVPDLSDVSVSIIKTDNYSLNIQYPILAYKDENFSSFIEYKAPGFYPSNLASIKILGYIRQQKVARLGIHPIQYNPTEKKLIVYNKIQIRVKFLSKGTKGAPSMRLSKQIDEYGAQNIYKDILVDTILNFDQTKNWQKSRSYTDNNTVEMAPKLEFPLSYQNPAYKLTIEKNGVYRLDYNYLVKAGIDPSTIDPRKIELKTGGKQVPIYVEGYQDGKFDREDFIEFYGFKMDSIYTNSNVYWLSWGPQSGVGTKSWMMAVKDGLPKDPKIKSPSAFLTTEHYEVDREYDPLKMVSSESADHFFWRAFRGQDPKFNSNRESPIPINLPYRAPNISSNFKLRVCFQGITYQKGASKHIMKIIFNGIQVNTAEWERQVEFISETSIPQIEVHRSNWLTLECEDNNGTVANPEDSSAPKWDVYLNWVEVDYWREFVADKDFLEFSTETIPAITRTARFTISNFSNPDINIFQIDKFGAVAKIINPEIQQNLGTYTVIFEDEVTQPTRYYITASSAIMRPSSIVKDEPSTLHDPANKVDYIMITHKNFMSSTQRLADFRRKQGLDVLVVDIDDIYDEFSYGIFDPIAIKRFLRYAYFNWDKIPTYVLLMGDAHWDYKYVYDEYYKKYKNYPRIYVPTYHGYNPPYGETAMDHRFVTVCGDDILPDMIIGRIPAETLEDANNAVDKIIAYETKPNLGIWQTKIMLVADDEKSKSGDEVFEDSSIDIENNYIPVGYETVRVYLRRIKEPYLARKMIVNNINEGVAVLQYSGHGGAYHWAHEGIFDYQDVLNLKNSAYPFVITTTCENGYFDNPQGGNKSLMELFLLGANQGAIGCLSATRLTYGQGNAVFSKIIYPKLFSETPPILGKIVNSAKIEFINLDISAWVASAEQYTIFGDPATKLALPELSIECELAKSSVDPSKKIEIKSGSVKRLKFDPITGEKSWLTYSEFNSQMRVAVIYPNNLDEDTSNDLPVQYETVKVWKGEFNNVLINIPNKVVPGQGKLRFYANIGNVSAIGGSKFSVMNPVVEQLISNFVNDESLRVYAAIVDNLGDAGIKSVECEWRNTETWKYNTYSMVLAQSPDNAPKIQGSWYVIKEDIPLSKPGSRIDYRIKVTDVEGNNIATDYQSIKVPIGVNLAITRQMVFMSPEIIYSYDQKESAWTLSVFVENNGSKEVKKPVAVYFFEGNPDRDADGIVDAEAKVLGTTIIYYDQWQSGYSGDTPVIQKANAIVKLNEPLYSGYHQIFVWVNPKISKLHEIPGVQRVEDNDEIDNKGSKLFQINEFLVGKGDKDTIAKSLDSVMNVNIPAGALGESIMSITKLEMPKSNWKQPDLKPAPIPEYGLNGGAFNLQLTSGIKSLNKPAKIDIKFDIMKMREIAKELKGLGNKKNSQLTFTERQWIETAMQEEAKKLAIYMWQEDIGVWRYIKSELVMSENPNDLNKNFAQEYYVTLPITDNSSDAFLDMSYITIDEVSTPIGNWAIFFLDSQRYKIYLRREGMNYYETLSRYGEVGKLYNNPDVGIQIEIKNFNEGDFRFGDIHRFHTYRDLDGSIRLRGFRNSNEGDGTARITIVQDDIDQRQWVGEWVIFFIDSKRFEIHNESGFPINDDEGEPLVGTIRSVVNIPSIGLNIEINDGKYSFQFGDKFSFRTLLTGTVRAEINSLGTLALMYNNDNVLPTIQLWVNGLSPQDGMVIPPRPNISIMLADSNGIDLKSFSFLVSINDRGFNEVLKDNYVASDRSQLESIPIFYSPILGIGKYKYRLSVKDFNGNITKNNGAEYVEYTFLVEEKPDVSPPKIEILADGQVIVNQQKFNKSPKFVINVSDDYAIDESSIVVSTAYNDEPLKPLEKNIDYSISVSENLKNAVILYSPQLLNGKYSIQVKASDTSNNIAYAQPNMEPITYVVDEKVEVRDVMNAPNPFSDNTFFTYYLTQPADKVIIKIYTIKGKLIRTIEQDSPKWKYNEEFWDSRDEDGNKLASGVYLYKFTVIDRERKIDRIGKLAIIR